jgi:predicted regulator of Ras-like GTPase activity (Roadblock/LC7/MglB family)
VGNVLDRHSPFGDDPRDSMNGLLQKIVEDTPGARAAILMGFDGIAIEQYVRPEDADSDIEALAMEFSFRFLDLRKAAESLDLGEVSDITIKAERGAILVRVLNPEFFVATLLSDAGHFGKGRWLLRSTAASIASQL